MLMSMLRKMEAVRAWLRQLYNIQGQQLDGQDISTIRKLILENVFMGRTALSRLLCEQWHWEQSNGQLKVKVKDRACRVLLLTLEKKEIILLRARLRIRESFNRRCPTRFDHFEINRQENVGKVSGFRFLTIKMVRFFTPAEELWE